MFTVYFNTKANSLMRFCWNSLFFIFFVCTSFNLVLLFFLKEALFTTVIFNVASRDFRLNCENCFHCFVLFIFRFDFVMTKNEINSRDEKKENEKKENNKNSDLKTFFEFFDLFLFFFEVEKLNVETKINKRRKRWRIWRRWRKVENSTWLCRINYVANDENFMQLSTKWLFFIVNIVSIFYKKHRLHYWR